MQYSEHNLDVLLDELEAEYETIAFELRPIHTRLVEIKKELEALIARKNPHAFSLAEVQILQQELREIDLVRIDGKYYNKEGAIISGQAACIDLLESCFEDVHELLALREAVSGENPLRELYETLINIRAKVYY